MQCLEILVEMFQPAAARETGVGLRPQENAVHASPTLESPWIWERHGPEGAQQISKPIGFSYARMSFTCNF